MRVLVADQDVDHRQQMVSYIQKLGHTVQEAVSGKDAVEQCRKKCPDLIFIDFILSGQSGIEVVRQIRILGGHAVWVPIVLTSKSLTDDDILKGMESGADDVLLKPVSEVRVKVKVGSAQRHLDLKEEVFKVAHELVVANRALQSVVTQDMLTGIGNSSSFDEALEREWFKAKNNNKSLALIMLNLDYFQAFNQTYGAEEGDKVIKRVADTLKYAMPTGDTYLARLMGETFALLVPNVSRDEALKVAEKLHTAVDVLKIPHKTSGSSDHVTASFGIAMAEPGHYTDPWDLKDAADFGLYKAKHYGRNRCYMVSEGETVK